jgi:cell division protein FtsB
LKIVKYGKEGNLGLIFMAQPNGTGGFIFEINNRQEYRLRQITGSIYKILSGDLRNEGWVKTSLMLETGKANIVEIRTINRKYDILLNNKYIMSFSEMAYRSGNFGYIAGPSTKGVVDFLYIFQNESSNKTTAESTSSQVNNEDVIALSESIIALRTQINRISAENEEMRTLIKAQRSEQEDVKSDRAYLQKQILELQNNIAHLRQSNDSLLQVNKEFSGIKSGTGDSGDNDIIIVLSKNLKAEKQRNDELKNENLQLKKELDTLRGNGGN